MFWTTARWPRFRCGSASDKSIISIGDEDLSMSMYSSSSRHRLVAGVLVRAIVVARVILHWPVSDGCRSGRGTYLCSPATEPAPWHILAISSCMGFLPLFCFLIVLSDVLLNGFPVEGVRIFACLGTLLAVFLLEGGPGNSPAAS